MEKDFTVWADDENPVTRRLNDVGLVRDADLLSYELGAQRGVHLCNKWNETMGVPEGRRAQIDTIRRGVAGLRVMDMTQVALGKLSIAEGRMPGSTAIQHNTFN